MINQITNRNHVMRGRESIRPNEERAPRGATILTYGVLNFLSRFGSRIRRTRTPIDTITNARRVPILQRLPASLTVKIAPQIATTVPVIIVVIQGVLNRGWTCLINGGSKPSRDMLQKTRV